MLSLLYLGDWLYEVPRHGWNTGRLFAGGLLFGIVALYQLVDS